MKKLFDPIMSQAIRDNNLCKIREFISSNPEHINCFTPFAGGTWLHFAAGENSVEVVTLLLELGFDPNKGDSMDSGLPIFRASNSGHIDIVKLLLEAGSQLDTSGKDSASNPLFAAIKGGSNDIVELFLKSGIDTSRTYGEKDNIDALAFAILYGRTEIVEVLALHNANNSPSDAERLILNAKEAIKPIGGLKQIQILPDVGSLTSGYFPFVVILAIGFILAFILARSIASP